MSELVEQSVTQVSDPSILLETYQWKNIITPSKIKEPYILLFTLNYRKELIDFCSRLRTESGKKLVYICLSQPIDVSNLVDVIIDDAGPQEFLGYINSAEMVITDSFHGTVFSLILDACNIFSYVPSSQKRGKRITDLLDTYNLSDHVLHDDLSISYKELEGMSIDKKNVSERMNNERSRSQEYLLKQLQ